MAYKDNWLRHLMAPFTGEGLNNTLARDFWRDDEDLWSLEQDVPWRWAKLLWVYVASVFAQVTTAGVMIAGISSLFIAPSAKWWLIAIGGGTAAMLLFAVLVATATWGDIRRRK